MTTPRIIRPHKGGRTARAPDARIRPQTLQRIHEAMRDRGKSFADLLEETYQGETEMDATTAHELAEQYTGIENEDATVTPHSDGSYLVELTSDVTVSVSEDGHCEKE